MVHPHPVPLPQALKIYHIFMRIIRVHSYAHRVVVEAAQFVEAGALPDGQATVRTPRDSVAQASARACFEAGTP